MTNITRKQPQAALVSAVRSGSVRIIFAETVIFALKCHCDTALILRKLPSLKHLPVTAKSRRGAPEDTR